MRRALLPASLALLLLGCQAASDQPEFPGLHPVVGTVMKGASPASGGAIQFAPDPERPGFMTNSEVGPDGKFSLSTVRTTDSKGERLPGAPAGMYRVTYLPPVLDQTTGNLPPLTLPKSVSIEAQSNDLKIELPVR